jgi:ribosomal protein L37AE/L43A
MTEQIKYNPPRCPKCGSLNTLYQKRTDNLLCRKCGHTFEKIK